MMKPITGQYECVHSSGVGLDYFTSRIDRLVLQANGRFSLVMQNKSRAANAAQSLINGQQVSNAAPETRREGSYTLQNQVLYFTFDDGTQDQGQLSSQGDGLHFSNNFFTKISDSTLLPSTNRMQKDMDDIARGLKIASTLGGFALKAAKGIHSTIQATQSPGIGPDPSQPSAQGPAQPPYPPQAPTQQQPPYTQPAPTQPPYAPPPQAQPGYQAPAGPPPVQMAPAQQAPYQQSAPAQHIPPPPAVPSAPPVETIFCDQCGARCRPGKRFCNNCGARLV